MKLAGFLGQWSPRCAPPGVLHSPLLIMSSLYPLAAALLGGESQGGSTTSQAGSLLHYTLPPEKLAQAYALYRIDVSLYLITTLYVFFILWLMLRMHYGLHLRNAAERLSRFWLVRAAVVIT